MKMTIFEFHPPRADEPLRLKHVVDTLGTESLALNVIAIRLRREKGEVWPIVHRLLELGAIATTRTVPPLYRVVDAAELGAAA